MSRHFENLTKLLDKIKTIGFWQRIFQWGQIKSISYDAYTEFKRLMELLELGDAEGQTAGNKIASLGKDLEHLRSENIRQDKELVSNRDKIAQLETLKAELSKENTLFKQSENDRRAKYENDVQALNRVREQIQSDRNKEIEDQQRKHIERLESMKETWSKHQDNVQYIIKGICDRNTVEYIDNVPFKGAPDNTVRICGEYVIFDAKSPRTDDLNNFPAYIKLQAESVKKYIKEEGVRRDIFLVIPSNAVEVIDRFYYNMADYNVYVVTVDVLEPLILNLKRIEVYEFVNELSPEEQENICRVIGKFAHLSKRRIQVDQYFAKQFMDMLTKCELDLPKDILNQAVEFERSEKLNPPQEKRAKQIPLKELKQEMDKIQKEGEVKEVMQDQSEDNALPLFDHDAKV